MSIYERDLTARVKRIREATGMDVEACKRAAKIEVLRERIESVRTGFVMGDAPVSQEMYDLLSLIDATAELLR